MGPRGGRQDRQGRRPLHHRPVLPGGLPDGHMAAVFMKFADGKAPSMEQIKADWAAFRGVPQELALPSAPKQFLHYFEEPDRPQTRLDRNLEHGMAVSVGRLRRTPSTTTSSCACPTTPCAAPPAAPSCWPSCCARKGIFNG